MTLNLFSYIELLKGHLGCISDKAMILKLSLIAATLSLLLSLNGKKPLKFLYHKSHKTSVFRFDHPIRLRLALTLRF